MQPFIINAFPDIQEWEECLTRYPLHQLEHTPAYWNPCVQTADVTFGLLRDGTQLVGFIPFEKKHDFLYFSFGDRRFFKLHFDLLRLIGREILSPDIKSVFDVIANIEKTGNRNQILSFHNISIDSPLYSEMTNSSALQKRYFVFKPYEQFPYYTINLKNSWENYLNDLSSKVRHELRRKVRRFDELFEGAVVCQEFNSEENLQQFHTAVEEISCKSWQRKRCGRRVVDDDTGATRKRLQHLASKGYFRSFILFGSGKPIAFAYGLQYGELYHLHEIAYDSTHETVSPGFVLLWHVLKNLHEKNPPLRCTLGGGEARFKRELCNEKTMVATLWIVPKTPVNVLKTLLYSCYSNMHHAFGNHFDKIGFKQKLLTWLRRK
jgi:hypothetical protein